MPTPAIAPRKVLVRQHASQVCAARSCNAVLRPVPTQLQQGGYTLQQGVTAGRGGLAPARRRQHGPVSSDTETRTPGTTALVVVDAQVGSTTPGGAPATTRTPTPTSQPWSGASTRPGLPVVYVQHDSEGPESPLHPDSPGHALKPYLEAEPDLLVRKTVNSSFHGSPTSTPGCAAAGITGIVVAGITTNHCETTARVGGNLGYDVRFTLDATYTFDRTGPEGTTMSAAELARATATNLHGGFATVVTTADVLASLR